MFTALDASRERHGNSSFDSSPIDSPSKGRDREKVLFAVTTVVTMLALGALAYLHHNGSDLTDLSYRNIAIVAGFLLVALAVLTARHCKQEAKPELNKSRDFAGIALSGGSGDRLNRQDRAEVGRNSSEGSLRRTPNSQDLATTSPSFGDEDDDDHSIRENSNAERKSSQGFLDGLKPVNSDLNPDDLKFVGGNGFHSQSSLQLVQQVLLQQREEENKKQAELAELSQPSSRASSRSQTPTTPAKLDTPRPATPPPPTQQASPPPSPSPQKQALGKSSSLSPKAKALAPSLKELTTSQPGDLALPLFAGNALKAQAQQQQGGKTSVDTKNKTLNKNQRRRRNKRSKAATNANTNSQRVDV
ncbi:hypothetical protein SCG7109_BU_00030 [Chlamydiales bacterium SCGC AG-110-M15]|nr:hypothetical protein SCG7109_BU_00030 [Chlamydiales bacterium SCGC AG-110-M15]